MTEFVKVYNNEIIHIVDTIDSDALNLECNNVGCETVGEWLLDRPMPSDNQAHVGDDIRKFDQNWKLRPLQELVDEGLISLYTATDDDPEPNGTVLEKISEGRIVRKTRFDLAVDGVIALDDYEYLDHDNQIISSCTNVEDLLSLGVISQSKADKLKSKEVRDQRGQLLQFVDQFAMHALRWNSLTQEQQSHLAEYRQALLDVPQQPGFPWDVEWPVKPLLES